MINKKIWIEEAKAKRARH